MHVLLLVCVCARDETLKSCVSIALQRISDSLSSVEE